MSPNALAPLKRRGILLVIGLMLLLVTGGTVSIFAAFYSGGPVAPRICLLFLATICLALPLWMAFVVLRRRIKSGHYLLTPEERIGLRTRTASQIRSPRYQRNMKALCGALTLFWIGIGTFWIREAIRNPDKRLWAVYWVTLATVNVIWMVRIASRSPFSIEPPSGTTS